VLEEVSGQAHNLEVGGSIPPVATNNAGIVQLVVHLLAKQKVIGSNPITRSNLIKVRHKNMLDLFSYSY
jgi:hypothetical protein